MKLYGKIVREVEVGGVDYHDYPDFSDAYFDSGRYADGTPLTNDELDLLQDLYPGMVNKLAFEKLVDNSDVMCYVCYDDGA